MNGLIYSDEDSSDSSSRVALQVLACIGKERVTGNVRKSDSIELDGIG